MKRAWVARERGAAVRVAARGWRSAGVIDAETKSRIEEGFPEPRLHASWVFRALTFVLVSVVVLAVFLAFVVSGPGSPAVLGLLCLAIGVACVAATEVQEELPRLASRGGAGATAFWAGTFLVAGSAFLAHRPLGLHDSGVVDVTLSVSTVVWGAACLRWGSPVWAIFSSTSFFYILARVPAGRVLWIVLGAALALVASRGLDDASWAPPHRESVAALLVVALAAVYAATNFWSVEGWMIERLQNDFSWTEPHRAGLVAAMIATAVMPFAVLAWGIRSRRTFLIDTGALLLVFSAITLRHYVRIAPLWAVLAGAGAILLGLALALERWLSRGEGRERGGFTAEPLFLDEAKARLLQVVPVAATLGPASPTPSAPPDRPFTPGGGSFGGGGASERF